MPSASLLKFYHVMTTTGGVTTASASSMRTGEQQQKKSLMCHVYVTLIPDHYLRHTLLVDQPALVKKLGPPPTGGEVADQSALPVLHCEGTNFVNPLFHHPAFYLPSSAQLDSAYTAFVKQRHSLENAHPALKRMLVLAEQQNQTLKEAKQSSEFVHFYRKVTELWLTLDADSLCGTTLPCELLYEDSGCYGVAIKDLVEKSMNLIKVHPNCFFL